MKALRTTSFILTIVALSFAMGMLSGLQGKQRELHYLVDQLFYMQEIKYNILLEHHHLQMTKVAMEKEIRILKGEKK